MSRNLALGLNAHFYLQTHRHTHATFNYILLDTIRITVQPAISPQLSLTVSHAVSVDVILSWCHDLYCFSSLTQYHVFYFMLHFMYTSAVI